MPVNSSEENCSRFDLEQCTVKSVPLSPVLTEYLSRLNSALEKTGRASAFRFKFLSSNPDVNVLPQNNWLHLVFRPEFWEITSVSESFPFELNTELFQSMPESLEKISLEELKKQLFGILVEAGLYSENIQNREEAMILSESLILELQDDHRNSLEVYLTSIAWNDFFKDVIDTTLIIFNSVTYEVTFLLSTESD
ncbi:MAG: hypothetical protein KDK38_14705 [Leptospiraceae bacterium]|nr:hypothetical protein [Leptospiraceae bacterium]